MGGSGGMVEMLGDVERFWLHAYNNSTPTDNIYIRTLHTPPTHTSSAATDRVFS